MNIPLQLEPWFTDGLRGYSAVTNCDGRMYMRKSSTSWASTHAQANSTCPGDVERQCPVGVGRLEVGGSGGR